MSASMGRGTVVVSNEVEFKNDTGNPLPVGGVVAIRSGELAPQITADEDTGEASVTGFYGIDGDGIPFYDPDGDAGREAAEITVAATDGDIAVTLSNTWTWAATP